MRHASPRDVGRFLVDTLGIFGIIGSGIHRVPRMLFEAEPRLSWVVNNAWAAESRRGVPLGAWEPSQSAVAIGNGAAQRARPLLQPFSIQL